MLAVQRGGVGVAPEPLHAVLLVRRGRAGFDEDVVHDLGGGPRGKAVIAADADALLDVECAARARPGPVPPCRLVTISVRAASIRAAASPIRLWISADSATFSNTPGRAMRLAPRAVSVKASSAPCAMPTIGATSAVGPKVG